MYINHNKKLNSVSVDANQCKPVCWGLKQILYNSLRYLGHLLPFRAPTLGLTTGDTKRAEFSGAPQERAN